MAVTCMTAGVRPSWLAGAILSGVVASMETVFTVVPAYAGAPLLAGIQLTSRAPAEPSRTWLQALTDTQLITLAAAGLYTALAIHVAVGLSVAVGYAYGFKPQLSGSPWQRGVQVPLLPCALPLVVFLPLAAPSSKREAARDIVVGLVRRLAARRTLPTKRRI